MPWRWKQGEDIAKLEQEFSRFLGARHAVSFNSGRSSMMAILRALNLKKGEEVLLQAFTCNAVPNPVLWEGLRPVYVDCREDDFNMDADDLEKKITGKSRVVVVQHTFGMPADMDRIEEVCRKHNLILLEDCAHALGATYKGRLVGTFGKASFFSFSRDKVISSVYGGMATTDDEELAERMRQFRKEIGYPSFLWILQQLHHVPVMNLLILPTYGVLGKYLLVLFQRLRVLSKAVHWLEKRGRKPAYFPKALPNALATLALRQFKKLEYFNARRKELAAFYKRELRGTDYVLPEEFDGRESIFLRFPV
ncbi:MAG: aminotransferase class I/II-fold pyridoxal phosphate-dependent enzyme, partial [bacterium]|nr:aminotransferase class I/II-fold pyridoxal phosphate-dependent enzyme [bacterium]